MRWWRRVGWVVALAGLLSAAPATGAGVRSQPASRVTWRGIHTVLEMGPTCRSQLVETFEFVGEETAGHDPRWLSRKVTWNYDASCANDILVLEDVGAGTPQRVLRPWTQSCENHGAADLQATPAPSVESRCQEQPSVGYRKLSALTLPGLSWTGPRPAEDMRNGCAYNSRSRTVDGRGNVRVSTYSVTVSRGEVDAVLDVTRSTDAEYFQFVPVPGEKLRFTARGSRPARFRFVLDPEGTSRFPGYATNAYLDDAFFDNKKYALAHLRGEYANDGPDVLFDREDFETGQWSRVEPGTVETREPASSASVTVTAMDYGAVGRLRAFAQATDCGGTWQPVTIVVDGQRREAIDIPLDDDHNLMADALEPYRGLEPGSDEDAEPKGNGMAGDGLTAFEEYRGFLVSGGNCADPKTDMHVRSQPPHKDLFVHTPDPDLENGLSHFAFSSGLSVYPICERHYSGNTEIEWERGTTGDLGVFSTDARRIVNHTLQRAGLKAWRGRTISQEVPQHGLYLINRSVPGRAGTLGRVCTGSPVCRFSTVGPPMLASLVIVDKANHGPDDNLAWTVTHELGHAVGIPHHGQRVEHWTLVPAKRDIQTSAARPTLVVAPGGACTPATSGQHPTIVSFYVRDQFIGCLTQWIVVHGAEHSGASDCPMRYRLAHWFYQAPGTDASESVLGDAILYSGRFLLYENKEEDLRSGRFCPSIRGTGLNGREGDRNHAGDSLVPCADQFVVNDNVLRGLR